MANIRDVAKRAGVSPATVSRVLNNNQTYKITNETRENVLRAVTELGYTPLIKKSDRSEREAVDQRFSIGCLLATTRGKYRDPYYLSLLSGIEDEMEKQGGVVSLIHTEQELEDPEILNRTLEAGLDGLVMMRPLEESLFSQLRERIPHIVGIDTGHMPIDNIEYVFIWKRIPGDRIYRRRLMEPAHAALPPVPELPRDDDGAGAGNPPGMDPGLPVG